MSDEDGLWASIQAEWIKVCPCRLIRKNICMFNIVLGCVERRMGRFSQSPNKSIWTSVQGVPSARGLGLT